MIIVVSVGAVAILIFTIQLILALLWCKRKRSKDKAERDLNNNLNRLSVIVVDTKRTKPGTDHPKMMERMGHMEPRLEPTKWRPIPGSQAEERLFSHLNATKERLVTPPVKRDQRSLLKFYNPDQVELLDGILVEL
jgi:hypothetical protein